MIPFKQTGDFSKTKKTFKKMQDATKRGILERYGKAGVAALASATPSESGKTAGSWTYEIQNRANGSRISFSNTNINKGVNIAIILQYGHGTGTGGWVQGRDYINPAIRPVFDSIAEAVWKEIVSA
jgi:hypothetical protein